MPGCLNALHWCDDMHVVDSGSTDKTVSIARRQGANVYINAFRSFAQQRNWALENCNLQHEWVLFLDADEHSTDQFISCIKNEIQRAKSDVAGFYCCGKTILEKKWLKRSDNFPKWQYRLMRKWGSKFVDVGHGQKEGLIEGRIGYINEPYLHFAFSRGFDAWTAKHIGYSVRDAKAIYDAPLKIRLLFSRHGSKRNTAYKNLCRRLPGWPLVRFVYSYILLGGFMEGREGIIYCRKILWYERQVRSQLKLLSKAPR